MPTLARLNNPSHGAASLEMAHNRDIDTWVDSADIAFFVLSGEVAKKYGVEEDLGEVLLYSPRFVPNTEANLDRPTTWVGQSIDFDYSTL